MFGNTIIHKRASLKLEPNVLWRNLTNILKSFAIICNKLRARFIKLKKRTSLRTQNTIRQFILFGLVGFVNTIVHYVCYIVLLLTGVHYILSNIIAFSVGVISAYFFNHRYVFNQCITQSRKFLVQYRKVWDHQKLADQYRI